MRTLLLIPAAVFAVLAQQPPTPGAARESRREIWRFLAGYLKPDRAMN